MFSSFKKPTPMADLQPGRDAVVEGVVEANRELSFSGSTTKCVYYDKLSESYEVGARGRGRKMWVPKNVERRCSGFFVRDSTGSVWITSDASGFEVKGAHREGGMMGKKGRQRYLADMIRVGDRVRAHGTVAEPKASDPSGSFVLGCNKKGKLKIVVKEKTK